MYVALTYGMDLWDLDSLSLILSLELIRQDVLQILVNYARSSSEAEQVCKEVTYLLYEHMMYFLELIFVIPDIWVVTHTLLPYLQNSIEICKKKNTPSSVNLYWAYYSNYYFLEKGFSNPKFSSPDFKILLKVMVEWLVYNVTDHRLFLRESIC